MLAWNNDELMIENYLDIRIACPLEVMQQLKKEGWEVLNMMRIRGERRYTMVLPERGHMDYVFTEENAMERFRQLIGADRRRERPVLRRVS